MGMVGRLKTLKTMIGPAPDGAPADGRSPSWGKPYEMLRKRWDTVPTATAVFKSTNKLIELSDEALLAEWECARKDITTGREFAHRGWYHTLYAGGMRRKKIMDVGCGFGVDSITFAQHGASLTFVDLVETNLKVLERLCTIMRLRDVQFHLLEDVDSLQPLDSDYDFIMAMGSLHHAPEHVLKPEFKALLGHLKIGGRWLQLPTPRRDGSVMEDHALVIGAG